MLSGDTKEEAKNLARVRRWREPVAVDEDGSLVNLYGVGVCPITVFARDGARAHHERREPHRGGAPPPDGRLAG